MKCLKCYSKSIRKDNKLICTKCKSVLDIDTVLLAKNSLDIIDGKKECDINGKAINKNRS